MLFPLAALPANDSFHQFKMISKYLNETIIIRLNFAFSLLRESSRSQIIDLQLQLLEFYGWRIIKHLLS